MTDIGIALQKLLAASSPEQVFGDLKKTTVDNRLAELRLKYNNMVRMLHPDRHNGSKESHDATAQLNIWRDRAEQKIIQNIWGVKDSGVSIKAGNLYKNVVFLTAGDICDVFMGEQDNGLRAVIKVPFDPKDRDLLQNEATLLKQFRALKDKESIHFQQYLPRLIEQARVTIDGKEQLVNIIEACELGYTLEQIHKKYPELDPRHVGWIWKRLLEGMGWINTKRNIIHGALLPPHIVVYPTNHGICILDWSYAVPNGRKLKAISSKYEDYYPPEIRKEEAHPGVDIFMAAKCAQYLLGGDLTSNSVPSAVPTRIRGFMQACLLPNSLMRYRNTWDALDALGEVLRLTYGPRKFVNLEM